MNESHGAVYNRLMKACSFENRCKANMSRILFTGKNNPGISGYCLGVYISRIFPGYVCGYSCIKHPEERKEFLHFASDIVTKFEGIFIINGRNSCVKLLRIRK